VVEHRARPLKLRIHSVLRWLHIYISMFCLLVILFFALTGITLNHADWAFGNVETKTELMGTLPAGWNKGNDEVNWLQVVEYLRKQHSVRGFIDEPQADGDEASVTFKAPGYAADCFIEQRTGKYELTITAQGIVAVMNDFHRGQNTGTAWSWVIDISGVLLAIISITGLGLLLYLKKIRTVALLTMLAGAAVVLVIMRMAA
jgi:hypothetical protein